MVKEAGGFAEAIDEGKSLEEDSAIIAASSEAFDRLAKLIRNN